MHVTTSLSCRLKKNPVKSVDIHSILYIYKVSSIRPNIRYSWNFLSGQILDIRGNPEPPLRATVYVHKRVRLINKYSDTAVTRGNTRGVGSEGVLR